MTAAVPLAAPALAVTVADPSSTAVTRPLGKTLATEDAEVVQAMATPVIVA